MRLSSGGSNDQKNERKIGRSKYSSLAIVLCHVVFLDLGGGGGGVTLLIPYTRLCSAAFYGPVLD